MPKLVLSELKGVNTERAAFQLPKGEVAMSQNVWTRPFKNWHKRNGIEKVADYDSPILGIFEIDLDNIVIPIIFEGSFSGGSGGTLNVWPSTGTASGSVTTPDPYTAMDSPTSDDLDPEGGRTTLFLFEALMRGVSERYAVVNQTPPTWPNKYFDAFGTFTTGGTAPTISRNLQEWRSDAASTAFKLPTNNYYQYDLTYADTVGGAVVNGTTITAGSPTGTYAAAIVNDIRDKILTLIALGIYVDDDTGIEDQASIPLWTVGSVPAAATAATYRSAFANLKAWFQKVSSFTIGGGASADKKRETGWAIAPTQPAALAIAVTAYNAESWVDVGGVSNTQLQINYQSLAQEWCKIIAYKSIYTVNLSSHIYPGSGTLFYQCSNAAGAYNPIVTADGTYHSYASIYTSSTNQQSYYSGLDTISTSSPVAWQVLSAVGQVYPSWQYPF